jgi:hypothetical protein
VILTILQLKRIAKAGGGLSLDASLFTFNQLADIVGAAGAGGKGSVSLRNVAGLNAAQLAELAESAPGLVSFEISP